MPEGPCGPSGPFVDRGKEKVRKHIQSCTANVHNMGYGVHTDACTAGWNIHQHRKCLEVTSMMETHTRAWRSGSPCFPFNTFATVLSRVTGIPLRMSVSCSFRCDFILFLKSLHETLECIKEQTCETDTLSPLSPLSWFWISVCWQNKQRFKESSDSQDLSVETY